MVQCIICMNSGNKLIVLSTPQRKTDSPFRQKKTVSCRSLRTSSSPSSGVKSGSWSAPYPSRPTCASFERGMDTYYSCADSSPGLASLSMMVNFFQGYHYAARARDLPYLVRVSVDGRVAIAREVLKLWIPWICCLNGFPSRARNRRRCHRHIVAEIRPFVNVPPCKEFVLTVINFQLMVLHGHSLLNSPKNIQHYSSDKQLVFNSCCFSNSLFISSLGGPVTTHYPNHKRLFR